MKIIKYTDLIPGKLYLAYNNKILAEGKFVYYYDKPEISLSVNDAIPSEYFMYIKSFIVEDHKITWDRYRFHQILYKGKIYYLLCMNSLIFEQPD